MARKLVTPPTPSTDFEKRMNERLATYAKDYRIEELNASNDKALLMILVRSELILEDLHNKLQSVIVQGDIVDQAIEVKKISDLIRDLTNQITTVQKTLSIDRKSRKEESEGSVADYIRSLKRMTNDFMEQRWIKVYCPDCKVMVTRIAPVHHHTSFIVETKCSQCDRMVIARREDKDIWFDVKDADWRRKHRAEIIQPKRKSGGFKPEDIVAENIVDVYAVDDKAEFDVEIDAIALQSLRNNIQREREINAQTEDERGRSTDA